MQICCSYNTSPILLQMHMYVCMYTYVNKHSTRWQYAQHQTFVEQKRSSFVSYIEFILSCNLVYHISHAMYCTIVFIVADSCDDGSSTCLAPTIIPSAKHPVAMYNTTNTSITVWWSLYSLPGCCYDTVFSYPLTRYYYGTSSMDVIEVEVSCGSASTLATCLAVVNIYTLLYTQARNFLAL